jgi:hypothetical protein
VFDFTTLFIGKKLDSDTQYMPKKGCMHKLPTGINDKHLHTVTFISGSHINKHVYLFVISISFEFHFVSLLSSVEGAI